MILLKKLLEIAGKNEFNLDPSIGYRYIIQQCCKYGLMMFRGKIFSIGYKKISSDVFIGKNVKIIEKRNLILGQKVKLHDGVYVDALSREGVEIGDKVVIGRNTRIECTGGLQSVGKGVKIGNNTTFGNDCMFGAAGGVEIGDNVIAGQYIRFHSENHKYNDTTRLIRQQGVTHKGIKIGNNCWIGAGAVFLDGAELEDGCVVAANAVVTTRFSKNSVIAGVPAKKIKERGSEIC